MGERDIAVQGEFVVPVSVQNAQGLTVQDAVVQADVAVKLPIFGGPPRTEQVESVSRIFGNILVGTVRNVGRIDRGHALDGVVGHTAKQRCVHRQPLFGVQAVGQFERVRPFGVEEGVAEGEVFGVVGVDERVQKKDVGPLNSLTITESYPPVVFEPLRQGYVG